MTEEEFLQAELAKLGLKKSLRKKLAKNNIHSLEDLLTIDYQELSQMRQLGISSLKVIQQKLHQAGYQIKNEENSIEEKRKRLKQAGKILLEDLGFNCQTYSKLYQEDIFTLQDLNDNWKKITTIKGYGPQRQLQLLNQLSELGVGVSSEELFVPKNLEQNILERKQLEQGIIKGNWSNEEKKRRETLLKKQQALLKEQQELKIREEEIKEELSSIRVELYESKTRKQKIKK